MDKVVLITGAGTGIGKATVELFARKGWQVVARVVYKAAKSQSKRLHYAAGRDAHLNIWTFKFLPQQLAMWLARRATMNKKGE